MMKKTNLKKPVTIKITFTDGKKIVVNNIVNLSLGDTWITFEFIDDNENTYCRLIKANEVKEVLLLELKREPKEDDLDKIREEWDEMFKDLFGDLM